MTDNHYDLGHPQEEAAEEAKTGCAACQKPECDKCAPPQEPDVNDEPVICDDNCADEACANETCTDEAQPACEEECCPQSEDPTPEACEPQINLQAELNRVADEIAALSKLFEEKIRYSAHEEKIVDQMHRELQKYKADMYMQLVRPILMGVIGLRDSIMRVADVYRSKPPEEQNIPLNTFELYAYEALEILEKNDIEVFKSEEGSDFVPIRHKALKKVPTPDQSLHGKVAQSTSDGYIYQGKVMSAEKIAVYAYEPQAEQTTNQEDKAHD